MFKIIYVIDGDTIYGYTLNKKPVKINKAIISPFQTNSVRLLLINTYETKENRRFERDMVSLHEKGLYISRQTLLKMGKLSQKYLRQLLPEQSVVELKFFTSVYDKYNRFLAIVYKKGLNINYKMIKEGMAFVYFPIYNSKLSFYLKYFVKAENFAKYKKYGLWKYLY